MDLRIETYSPASLRSSSVESFNDPRSCMDAPPEIICASNASRVSAALSSTVRSLALMPKNSSSSKQRVSNGRLAKANSPKATKSRRLRNGPDRKSGAAMYSARADNPASVMYMSVFRIDIHAPYRLETWRQYGGSTPTEQRLPWKSYPWREWPSTANASPRLPQGPSGRATRPARCPGSRGRWPA